MSRATLPLLRALAVSILLFAWLQYMMQVPINAWGSAMEMPGNCVRVGEEFVDAHYLKLQARGGHPGKYGVWECDGVVFRSPE